MAKFYDRNFTREDIKNLQRRDVIRYSEDGYFIVHHVDVEKETIFGQKATTISVNAVLVEDLVGE